MSDRRRIDVLAMLILVALIFGALYLMSEAVQQTSVLADDWFIPLMVFTAIGLITLTGVVGVNLFRLWREYRRREPGVRLNVRLARLFILLSFVPVAIVYFYSWQFLSKGVDSWFQVSIEDAMNGANALGQTALDLHKKGLVKDTERILAQLDDASEMALGFALDEARFKSDAVELIAYRLSGAPAATSRENTEIVSQLFSDEAFVAVREGTSQAMFEMGTDQQSYIKVLAADPRQRGELILQALYPMPDRLQALIKQVQGSLEEYRSTSTTRDAIFDIFAVTLALAAVLAVFGAIWGALYTSRQLVRPVRDISIATEKVAVGMYDTQVPMPKVDDELSFLVDSFNQMTQRIGRARYAAEMSKNELQLQHNYLETVMGALTTGVIALDKNGKITTANLAAEMVLGLPLSEFKKQPLTSLGEKKPVLDPFVDRMWQSIQGEALPANTQITLYRENGHQTLLCRHSVLPASSAKDQGHVLVFDDVTELVHAQKDAAWAEVARRLAHEIKNPLTPIQLASERLRHHYLKKMSEEEARVLDRSTTTIVNQVDALKSMVNDFSEYAKPSKMDSRLITIDNFIGDVLALYETAQSPVVFMPGAQGVKIEGDPVRLRQVIHNLVKNGLEALGDKDGKVRVITEIGQSKSSGAMRFRLRIEDDGTGFDTDSLGQVFEPYVTNKPKGTGLGLAIVKRIVGEHGGTCRASNRQEGGASIQISLPVRERTQEVLEVSNS
jgi:PAS domain S-box-containing protein